MKRASTLQRIERLDALVIRLKSDEPLIVGTLAAEFGVSVRTLSRDIEMLREQGLPVEADRGRGGGVRLHWSWGIGRVELNYSEAVDLLISLAVAEQMKSPLLMANLNSVRRKLMASFSLSTKHKINGLKSRILIAESASPFVLSAFSTPSQRVVDPLYQAFLMQHKLEISYRREDGTQTKRVIEPHYFMLSYPVWYVLAFDELRGAVRTFRCDRIGKATIVDEGFRLAVLSRFEQAMEGINAIQP